jgi:hypothetical protein
VVQVVQHVSVLVSPQPLAFPVESKGPILLHQLPHVFIVFDAAAVGEFVLVGRYIQIIRCLSQLLPLTHCLLMTESFTFMLAGDPRCGLILKDLMGFL